VADRSATWANESGEGRPQNEDCYDRCVFNFGKPKTAGDWIGHFLLVIVALFLVWWMLRLFVL
jgi:hypothetical protein